MTRINNKKLEKDMGNSVTYGELQLEFKGRIAPPSVPVFKPSYYRRKNTKTVISIRLLAGI